MKKIVSNKKAKYEYTFLDIFVAGIILVGSEVKSIRKGEVNLKNSHCYLKNNELYVTGMFIAENKESGKYQNHEPLRERKLLLNKKELKKLIKNVEIIGNTIVPINLLLTEKGYIKLEIALAKGKKLYDKKESLKDKSIKLTEQRENKLKIKL